MFKSIFSKYIAIFMLITVLSFTLLAFLIGTMMADYYTKTSERQLETGAKALANFFEERLSDTEVADLETFVREHKEETKSLGNSFMRLVGSDYSFIITDTDGKILISAGFSDPSFSGDRVAAEIMAHLGEGLYSTKGDMLGLLDITRSVCGIPLEQDGGEIGAVFLCTTSQSIRSLSNTTVKTIIMTCLWTMFAVLIAIYFATERMTAPLKSMSKAAKAFAQGKFDRRVPVTGHDEISELGLAMNNMAQSLESLEKNRSDFLSSVSHDMKTPMTTISGFIDALLDGTIPEEKRDYYLRLIGDEVRRLSRLVTALLDITRIQSGDRKFVMKSFDICEMARVILISFEQKIDKKGLEVEFDTEADNMFVKADYDAIYQILYNICDNAVKFSREGGLFRIKISSLEKKTFVSVYNEGQGILSEDLPRVFERFYKGDRSRGMDKNGTGLGMYIAKTIIDAHGEEIWAKSTYGEYCEFVFTLTPSDEAV